MGNPTRQTDAKASATTVSYASNGVDPVTVTDGLGTVRMGYDGFRNMSSMTDRMGNRTRMAYNGYGQPTSVTEAESNVTSYTYYDADATGHLRKNKLQSVTRAGQTLYSYDYDDKGIRLIMSTCPTPL